MDMGQKKSSSEDEKKFNPEKNSFHKEHPTDAKIRRIKDCLLFVIVLIMILGVFCYCVSVFFNIRSFDEDRKWATLVITAIISALLGYLVGKSSK
ncbi:hypothetical protein [Legionella longbeachae]|uniref:Uncharacterized protein n=1 Tax=Legionella longbeachae serogroup 1 (strain NSW150) TaxID=661367 RepID=D3HR34_LEGLN|nr:hypothetical protein [Legionella longbeachae]VEE01871.1 Uncharacterised protein [Legionella oakridgensis]HBD7396877.1 hypothetical protein [Legionella pneumophila]ARB91811.1 hypothetical protein A6J40_06265 [Legionella longbeachae]ARM35043.1 hypothetical protein B0B39_16685 [Legionella longbeachae]EEZ95534.1 hypothetical protein LLB_0708 [Legionella longbeachae D-4968]